MKRTGILHPDLLAMLATAGHGDRIVIADAGLKIPPDAWAIDLALICGVPRVVDVVRAVADELVIESAEVAAEFAEWNPAVFAAVGDHLPVAPTERPHRVLMDEMEVEAFGYVKTGECTAYSSVVVTCGVSYLDDAITQYRQLHGRDPS